MKNTENTLKTNAEPNAGLGDAIAIAATVHRNQKDHGGAPYILHPLRIMMKMPTLETQIVAVLHDVIEDSSPDDKWTIERLRGEGFSEEVLAAVDCLSERDGESYDELIARAAANPIARQVKLGDLEDNMDPRRIVDMTKDDHNYIERFHRNWRRLKGMNQR